MIDIRTYLLSDDRKENSMEDALGAESNLESQKPSISNTMTEPQRPHKPIPTVTSSGTVSASGSGYCLWEFDGSSWVLKKDRSASGFVPSSPPTIAGRFRGQLRAIMAVPAPSNSNGHK
ncbi:hypothetical protein BH23PLA1_BH23PLA1_11340 [soil metagenome]